MPAAKTVLVMDDDLNLLEAVRAALEERGYRVLTAADGVSGLAAFEREAPDVVVVDMMLPRASGFSVAEKVKNHPAAGGPPVIMITANEGTRHRDYAAKIGVDEYLCKPFAVERLVESVERLCPST